MIKYALAVMFGVAVAYLMASFVYLDFGWWATESRDARFGWLMIASLFGGLSLIGAFIASNPNVA